MTTKSIKRATAVILSAAMAMSGMLITDNDAAAAAKPMLASKKGTVDVGKSTTVKIKNVKKKNVKALKVSSSDNGVAVAKKSGKTAFKVTGKSAGKAKITAKLTLKKAIAKKKTYTLKYTATVKDTSEVPVVTEAPAESTIIVGSFGELTTALASAQQTGGKVVTLVTQEAGPFEIGEATYDKVDLIVDAPNATITNNASFRSITLKASPQLKAASLSIKAEIKCKWFEKGKNNSITLDNAQAIHVVLQSAGSVAALIVKGSASEQSVIEIVSGTLNSLSIISKEPVKIVAKGTGEIKDVTMSAAGGNAAVEASENAKVGKVDIKEGTMGVNASGNSAVSTIVVEGASKLDLSGDSKNPTKIDATQAGKDAKVVIEKGVTGVTVEVDKNNASDQKKIIEDQSGQAKVVETGVTTPTKAPVSTATPAPSSGGSSGGSSSGGSSGGSSGSGSGGGGGGGSTAQTEAEAPSFTDVSVNTWVDKKYVKDDPATDIVAEATVSDGGDITYQWYKNRVAIEGATTTSLTPETTTTGQVTYYCVATNTNNAKDVKTKTNKSVEVTITVVSVEDAAALKTKFKTNHAGILAKTTSDVTVDDETAVNAALGDLASLPATVQDALNSENQGSTFLNGLKNEIIDQKAEAVANAFKSDHATILEKTPGTDPATDFTLDYVDALQAAIDAYDAIEDDNVYDKLNTEKAKLDNLFNYQSALFFKQYNEYALSRTADENRVTGVKIEDREDIIEAYDDYQDLDSGVKTYLTTEGTLLTNLKAYVENLAANSDADEFFDTYGDTIELDPATITLADKSAIVAAQEAYDGLTAAAKAKVNEDTIITNTSGKLTALLNQIRVLEAAAGVEELIKALPAAINVTKTSYDQDMEDQIDAAYAAYEALSDPQKAAVTPALKSKYDEVLAAQTVAYTGQVADVEELIDDLPPTANIKVRHEDQVRGAKAAYDALTTKGQASVTAAKVTTLNNDVTALENALIRQEIDELAETINGGTYNVTYTTKAAADVLAAALTTKVSEVVTDGYTIDGDLRLLSSNYTGTLKSTENAEITATIAIPEDNVSFAPKKRISVAISGDLVVGATLTATVDGTNKEGVANNAYQWYRVEDDEQPGEMIDGANSSTYVLTADELGKSVFVEIGLDTDTYKGDFDLVSCLPTDVIKTSIATATVAVDALTYTGRTLTPVVTVTLGEALTPGTDYELSYKKNSEVINPNDILNAGTYTAVITGKGGYTGEVTKNFTVSPADISTFTTTSVAIVNQLVYTGDTLEPEVTVTLDDEIELVMDTDFTVAYKKGSTPVAADALTDAGDYTVTVTGTGNYTGTADGAFSIAKGQATLTVTPLEGGATIEYAASLSADEIKALFAVEKNFGDPAWTFKKGDDVYGAFTGGAGSWLAKVTIADTDNYDGVTVEDIPFTVTKQVLTASRDNVELLTTAAGSVDLSDNAYVFTFVDSQTNVVDPTGDANWDIAYSVVKGETPVQETAGTTYNLSEPGEYIVTATFTADDYEILNASYTITVTEPAP